MDRYLLSVIAAALLLSVVLFTPASASSGEVRLFAGLSYAWEVELDKETRVTFDIAVEEGGNIDVYLMTASEHRLFQQGEPFTFIAEGSFTGIMVAEGDLVLLPGSYRLVAVSTAEPSGPDNMLSYSINVETTSASAFLQSILSFGAGVIFCLMLIHLFDLIVRRRKDAGHLEDRDER